MVEELLEREEMKLMDPSLVEHMQRDPRHKSQYILGGHRYVVF